MLITFCNTKGGVGKSTMASHLVLWLHDRGYRVALLDTDEQETAASWIRAAEPAITVRVATTMDDIMAAARQLIERHDVVVGDSPGENGDPANTITLLSDIAIVPVQPSKPDIRALKKGLKAIRFAQQRTGGERPAATLVLYFVKKRDARAGKLKQQLDEYGLPVAASRIRRLDAFRDACDSAVTRMKTAEGRDASVDIDALFNELFATVLSGVPPTGTLNQSRVKNE